ncbi:MAG: PAS domain-containing protein [Nitrosomonadaceae bacterium]|nr:PAS domain-containing protein [Nitrosomonadaceae bacterium]
MTFLVEKDLGLIPLILTSILDSCVNGISLADPDQADLPLVYVNKAFEKITGYSSSEAVGKNCRFMQGNDCEQIEIEKIKEAIRKKESDEVVLRNFRKNGELFYNHLLISPLFDSMGNLLYYLGIQYDLSSSIKAEEEIRKLKESF